MTKLFLTFSVVLISLQLFSRDYETIKIFDAKVKTSNNIIPVDISESDGKMIEIDFTSIDCDSLKLNIGYGLTDVYPIFFDSIPNQKLPIILDKNKYSKIYRGLESNVAPFDIFKHNGSYLWLEIIDNQACTNGEILLRL